MNSDKATEGVNKGIVMENKTGTEAEQLISAATRLARTHQRYWEPKLRRRSYVDGSGKRVEIREWQIRMQHLCRREWFNTHSANKSAAAVIARDIYLSLVASGWDATLQKYKPSPMVKVEVSTVGQLIAAVKKYGRLKPTRGNFMPERYPARTINIYAVKLRKLVSDVARLESRLKKRQRRAKYDHFGEGHAKWLEAVDSQRLDVLTAEKIQSWRDDYVAGAGDDPTKRDSAARSAGSIMRAGHSLFAAAARNNLPIALPANPFADVPKGEPEVPSYESDVDPGFLLQCADRELRQNRPQLFIGLYLCLMAGLRRKEADTLLWSQVNFQKRQIEIKTTPHFRPKTQKSARNIAITQEAVELLRTFKQNSATGFVMDGADPDPKATYASYRANCTWRLLNEWLKGKGVKQRNSVHSLRKESGSIINSAFGIYAAQRHLGHADIVTTARHYLRQTEPAAVNLPLKQPLRPLEKPSA